MKNIYVCKKMSKNGTPYVYMYIDMGYRLMPISYDMATIVELAGTTFEFINSLDCDKPLLVGNYNKVGK